jgi:hypothetical protein
VAERRTGEEELGFAVIAQGSGSLFIGGPRGNKAAEKGVGVCRMIPVHVLVQ